MWKGKAVLSAQLGREATEGLQTSILFCISSPVPCVVLPVMLFPQYQHSFHQDLFPTSRYCWEHIAEAACYCTVKFRACVVLGPLMPTRIFDHRVGKGRGRKGDSHAGGSNFPWEPPKTAWLVVQVQGWQDNRARSAAWEQGESATPESLGKAWVTSRRAASRKAAKELQREGCEWCKRLLRHHVTCGLADDIAFA